MTTVLSAMQDLVTRLGLPATEDTPAMLATADPKEAANNRPCFLVVPPALDYTAGTMTAPEIQLRVMVLSSRQTFDLDTVTELEPMLEHAEEALPEVQRAEPTLYSLTQAERIPAYVLTLTTL